MQVITVVPDQGGRFQSVFPLTIMEAEKSHDLLSTS